MSTAREVNPRNNKPVTYEGAPRGMIHNAPHEDLPEGALASLTNALAYPTEIRPRNGTRIVECPIPPTLSGRSGYRAYKVGNRIISDTAIFSVADISHWWVWPGELGDQHDEIQQYVSPTEVRTGTSGDIAWTSGCWMHARINLWEYHNVARKVVFQWGSSLYQADVELSGDGVVQFTNRTLLLCRSSESLQNSDSTWDQVDRQGLIFNPGGMFAVDFDKTEYWKRNTPVPQALVIPNSRTPSLPHRYSYLYAMAKLDGQGLRDRTTPGADILQQSGSNKLVEEGVVVRDYGDMWTARPVGDGSLTTGRLVCKALNDTYKDPTQWSALASPGGSFTLLINGVEAQFCVEYGTDGYNVQSLGDVALANQTEIRKVFRYATSEYDSANERFIFTAGNIAGSTIGYGSAGTGGTDVSGWLNITLADDAEVDNAYAYQQDIEVGILRPPLQEFSSGIEKTVRERHWTHYVVIRSEDIGPEGRESRVDDISGEILPPVEVIWVMDARCAGAFWASKDTSGVITAIIGEFEHKDEGTPFDWEDGETDTLGTYIDSTHMLVRGGDYYYGEAKDIQAAAIGGGRVTRASQEGYIVTWISGDDFSGLTPGETLWTSDGHELVIEEVISDTEVRVTTSGTRTIQGFTCVPTGRVINDTIPDGTLRNRAGERHVGFFVHRYKSRLPNLALGIVVPGFAIGGNQNGSLLHYSELGVSTKYMCGYYFPNRQVNDRIEGAIQGIRKAPNKFIVWCRDSTWGGPTNVSDSNIKSIPNTNIQYAVIYADVLSESIGVVDVGSIADLGDGVFEMRCQDGSVRQFNGTVYDMNLGDLTMDPQTQQDRVRKDLGETWPQSAGVYSTRGNLGYVLWEKQKV